MEVKLTLSFVRLLDALLVGELNYADFSSGNRKILEKFISDGVLDYRVIGKQQRKIFCPDSVNLASYLHNKFEIPSLTGYIEFLELEDVNRSDAVLAASDSKHRKTKVFVGFLVNCYEELACELDHKPFQIVPAKGIFTFITDFQTFKIPADVTIVVVEGHENFRDIDQQKHLFEGMRPLFVWRFQNSNAIADWLKSIVNPYIHFGDFDLKGIHIYLSEFKNKIQKGRGTFFIPPNIEVLLKNHGEKELFETQKMFLPIVQANKTGELAVLIELILKYRKGLAQEVLIKSR